MIADFGRQNMKRQGGCLCSQVRYELSGEPLAVVICHCKNCQKQSGSTFSINIIGQSEQIEIQGNLSTYADTNDSGDPVNRNFCENCGSPIFSEILSQGNLIALKVGTLDDTSDIEPQTQFWCISKQNWLSLDTKMPALMRNS